MLTVLNQQIYVLLNVSQKCFLKGSLKLNPEGVYNFSPVAVTKEALSTKHVMSRLASAFVSRMLLAGHATSVLSSTMGSQLKDVR